MEPATSKRLRRAGALALVTLAGLSLGACNIFTRLSEIGSPPKMTPPENPAVLTGNQPLEMPMPAAIVAQPEANSLWRPGAKHFLRDQRASKVGDIVTINIDIDDEAELSNSTQRTRDANEDASLSSFLGFEAQLASVFPNGIDPTNLVGLESASNAQGAGTVQRDEEINLRVAAIVTQVLPNGNLVIAGRQEVRVNFELRQLQVAGIIRPEDIASANTVEFDQIAEARMAYGGRGQLSDVQQPRYGQQLYDILWPF